VNNSALYIRKRLESEPVGLPNGIIREWVKLQLTSRLTIPLHHHTLAVMGTQAACFSMMVARFPKVPAQILRPEQIKTKLEELIEASFVPK